MPHPPTEIWAQISRARVELVI